MTIRPPPNLQQVLSNAQNKLAATFSNLGIEEISPTLSPIFSVDALLDSINWFVVDHTMVGNLRAVITLDPVPAGETQVFHHIGARESVAVRPWNVRVVCPAQGNTPPHDTDTDIIVASSRCALGAAGTPTQDLLAQDRSNSGAKAIQRPLIVYPGCHLVIESNDSMTALADLTVAIVQGIGAPPNTSRQLVVGTPVVTEV